jgi:isoleucyl-tRNA synthetase
LLYYAIDSWFIKTTAVKNKIIKNNLNIKWYPHHMQRGRFGDFLQNMKDWALSRNRFWGTPLNIWTCEEGHEQAVGSRKELIELAKDKELAAKVELHRPYIDEIILKCKCGKEMQRVPHVIDAWFDSGMMHTAQWHYPSENEEKFKANFPADFICEGQDQTRGWFYTLLVTSTLLYNKESFKCVLVTGYGLDAEGKAMSKSRGNVIDPWDVIDRWGADAIRWYLYSSGAPWKTRRLAVESVGEVLHGMLGTLRNVYNFFALYAKIDGFNPAEYKMNKPTILDRWITSRLNSTIDEVTAFLDDYNVVDATGSIERFVDDLSKWYVRCSRRRFWGSGMDQDKVAAYLTLYHVLVELSKLLAPFAPFLADLIYQNLKTNGLLSVHLCDWPKGGEIDRTLEEKMATVRAIAALGRAARQEAKIKVRQPLAKIVVKKTPQTAHLKEPELKKLLLEELNIKELEIADDLKTKEKAVKLEEEGGENAVAILTEITSDLMEEGFVRELCHRIQWLRKRAGYKVTDRIKLYYEADLDVERMMRKYEEHIKEEVLAKEIYKGIPEEVDFSSKEEINGLKATLGLIR